MKRLARRRRSWVDSSYMKSTRAFMLLIIGCLVLYVAALSLVAIYYAGGIGWTTILTWKLIAEGYGKVTPHSFAEAFSGDDLLLLIPAGIGLLVVFVTRNQRRSVWRFTYFALQLLIVFYGWLGLLLLIQLPFEITSLDGEWLGEDFPILITAGVWLLVSAYIAVASLWTTDRPSVEKLES